MKKFLRLLTVLGLLAALAGCTYGLAPDSAETITFLNHDPDADAAWQEITKTYAKTHNVEVTVLSVEPEDYEQTLEKMLEEGNGPAIISGTQDLLRWQAYLLDLKGTELAAQCVNDDYNLLDGDAILAVGYSKEYTGIVVNKALLKAAGHSQAELSDFEGLKAVAEDITARSEELRFGAFTSGSEDAVLLMLDSALGGDTAVESFAAGRIQNLQNVLTLYAQNGTADGITVAFRDRQGALSEFTEGKATFFFGSSTLYPQLTQAGMRPEDLTMIPLCCGTAGEQTNGLLTGTSHYWAVNSQASDRERELALEFLSWMASAQEGTGMLQELYGEVPFRGGGNTENVFCLAAKDLEREGRFSGFWAFDRIDESRLEELSFAMRVYFSAPSEENWAAIVHIFEGA
ncbi:MAG: ABC transporter substrate-binding protein [Faecousia sp.]